MASEIFKEISSKIEEEPKTSKEKDDRKMKTNANAADENNNKPVSSESAKNTKASKSASKSERGSKSQELSELASLLTKGFEGLQKSIENLGDNVAKQVTANMEEREAYCMEVDEESDYSEDLAEKNNDEILNEENDLFKSLMEDFNVDGKIGKPVNSSLAELCNKLLKSKMDKAVEQQKSETYVRPKNVEYVNTPATNKIVFDSLNHSTKMTDVNLQLIQKCFLSSVIPLVGILNDMAQNDLNLEKMNANDIIKKITDSIAFIGSANTNMIKTRKQLMKRDLPTRMQGICNDGSDFSAEWLFGDNLSSKVKELSELNRVSSGFRRAGFRNPGRGSRGNFRGTRGGRVVRRNRGFPYSRSGAYKNFARNSGNRKSPSN